MKNIFKIFKRNKELSEENKILKSQIEALTEFRKSFENYYNDVSGVKIITKSNNNQVVLNAAFTLDDEDIYRPIDRWKDKVICGISEQLLPFVKFDVVDNGTNGTKDLVGRLTVLTK